MNLTKEQIEIVKKEHPEWFSLANGKWYFHTISKALAFKVSDNTSYGFGFPEFGSNWYGVEDGTTNFKHINDFRLATDEEVKQALINEAKKRYKPSDNILCLDGKRDYILAFDLIFYNNSLYLNGTNEIGRDGVLYKDGKWAEIVSNTTDIHTDIQALKDKYKDYNLTIIAEKK